MKKEVLEHNSKMIEISLKELDEYEISYTLIKENNV